MSLGANGIQDWLTQRLTAVFLIIYIAVLLYFCFTHSDVNYESWKAFMFLPAMKVMTMLALLSISLHAWIGVWTIVTDYIHHNFLRQLLRAGIILALVSYFFWGFQILYGVL
tara:strand:- start:5595 stop:5930 length:336 start_codon:yes stop_codon:yes gene_type:complete